MIEKLAENLVNLKKEFVSNYDGTSQIQELIPTSNSESNSISNLYPAYPEMVFSLL